MKTLLVVLFFGFMVAIGFFCRKYSSNVNGFLLAGRSVGPWLTAFAYGTSYFSAVVFVGYAGQFGWKYGLSAVWIGLGNAFIGSLLAWIVLGRRTRIMTQHLDTATMPDFFAKRFNSVSLKVGAAVISFVFLIPYTASLYNGLSRLFGMAFDIDYSVCVIGMAVLTGIYVITGGYLATAITDFVQGLIMLVGIVLVVNSVLNVHGGFFMSIMSLSKVPGALGAGTLGEMNGVYASMVGPEPIDLLGVVILTSLGVWGLPQMVSKFYAIRSEGDVSRGEVVSCIFALVIAGGSYLMGSFGRLWADELGSLEGGYDVIVPMMLRGLGSGMIGLVVVLVLSASMSTLSSLVMSSSSVVVLDLMSVYRKNEMTDKQKVIMMRVFIVIFIAISVVIALIQYHSAVTFIAQLMGVSWGALAGAFLAPFLYSLYWKKVSVVACWVNFLFSSIVMTANIFLRGSFPALLQSPINAGAFCMLAGLVIVPVISIFTPKPDDKFLADTFSCYTHMVSVKQTSSLPDID